MELIKEPYPHYREEDIFSILNDVEKKLWCSFIYGQTVLVRNDGGSGIYETDWDRFQRILWDRFQRILKKRSLDELTKQAQELKMGY